MFEEEKPGNEEEPTEEESIEKLEESTEEPPAELSENLSTSEESPQEISISEESKIEELHEELPGIDEEQDSELEEIQGELSADDIENIDALLDEVDIEEPSVDSITPPDEDDGEVKVISMKELTEKSTKRNTIEAALLAAQRPIGIEEISIKLELPKTEIAQLIQELAEDYMDRQTAIEIVQIGEGYSMQIKPEYTEKIVKFASGGLIPKAVMRTLTIVAVKQPLLKSLLVKMRGSTAYEHCKFLIDRGYVTAYKKGRSSILETTDQFADTFGLSRNVETLKKQLIEQLGIQSAEELPVEEESTDLEQVETQQENSAIIQPEEIVEPGTSLGTNLENKETEHVQPEEISEQENPPVAELEKEKTELFQPESEESSDPEE